MRRVRLRPANLRRCHRPMYVSAHLFLAHSSCQWWSRRKPPAGFFATAASRMCAGLRNSANFVDTQCRRMFALTSAATGVVFLQWDHKASGSKPSGITPSVNVGVGSKVNKYFISGTRTVPLWDITGITTGLSGSARRNNRRQPARRRRGR